MDDPRDLTSLLIRNSVSPLQMGPPPWLCLFALLLLLCPPMPGSLFCIVLASYCALNINYLLQLLLSQPLPHQVRPALLHAEWPTP